MTPQKGQRLGGRGKPPEPTSTRTDPPAPTAPKMPEERPVEAPAGNGRPVRPVAVPPPRAVADARAQMDKAAVKRWRHQLGAAALRVAAQRNRLREAEDEWADIVADARAEGAPERLVVAAAMDADVDVPER